VIRVTEESAVHQLIYIVTLFVGVVAGAAIGLAAVAAVYWSAVVVWDAWQAWQCHRARIPTSRIVDAAAAHPELHARLAGGATITAVRWPNGAGVGVELFDGTGGRNGCGVGADLDAALAALADDLPAPAPAHS
jgi:hypothetical protein